jgi:long-subunit acyl-CoA synthetase (AMP-forming)
MFAVLPMHHTFECSLGFLAVIYNGCCNAFPTSLLRLTRDMQEVKPTVIFTVPLLVEKMHDKIVETLDESKPGQMLFKYGGKLVNYANDKFGIDLSRKVFSLVLKNLGGRLRLFIIGAAAIVESLSLPTYFLNIFLYGASVNASLAGDLGSLATCVLVSATWAVIYNVLGTAVLDRCDVY